MMFTTPSRESDLQTCATPTDQKRARHTADTIAGIWRPSDASDLDDLDVARSLEKLAQASASQAASIARMSECLEAVRDALARMEAEQAPAEDRTKDAHAKYQARRRKLGVDSLLLAEELRVDAKLSVDMVAELLNVHRTTVYARVNSGKFPRYDKSNGRTEWPLSVVREFLANKGKR